MTMQHPRLLLRVETYPDESWESYLIRMNQHNYPHSPRMLFTLYREWCDKADILDTFLLPRLAESYHWLSHLVWLTPQAMLERTMHRYADITTSYGTALDDVVLNDKSYSLLSQLNSQHYVSTRFCPHCLAEASYHRQYWSLRASTFCLKHDCLLLDRCTACLQTVSVSAICSNQCACGAFLSHAETMDVHLDKIGYSVQQRLFGWLHDRQEPLLAGQVQLTSRANYSFVHHIGEMLMEHTSASFQHRVSGIRVDPKSVHFKMWKQHRAWSIAFSLLTEFPRLFHRFLSIYRRPDTERRSKPTQMIKAFGRLSTYIQQEWTHPDFDVIREAFDDFFITHYAQSYAIRQTNFYKKRPDIQKRFPFLTYREAGELLDLKPKLLTPMTHLGHLRRIKSSDSSHYLFERESVEACNAKWSHSLMLEALPVILGCSPDHVSQLLEAGFLVTETHLSTDAISVRYPQALLTGIFYQCRQNKVSKTMIPLLEAVEQGQLDLVDFLKKVLSDTEIAYIRVTSDRFNLSNLYVSRRQLSV
jgi:hypothetical protein